MGENKKYYWLKLKEDFFRDKEIKKLRKIAGGDTYTIIYLKLQLLSLKREGKLIFENLEDSFAEEMALELDESTENVKMTLLYLQKCGLIEEVADNEYMLPQTMKSIGTETQGAERMRRCRENKQVSQCDGQALLSDKVVIISDTEIDIEKEIRDKSKDIKKEVKCEKAKELFLSDSSEYRLSSYLWEFIKKNNSEAKEPNIQKWSKVFDLMLRVDKRKVEDIKSVIEFCQKDEFWYKNVLSADKVRKHYDKLVLQMKEPKYNKSVKKGVFNDYPQREYNFKELETQLLSGKSEIEVEEMKVGINMADYGY